MNKKILYIWSANWPWDIRIDKEAETLKKNGYDVSILARNTNNMPTQETDNDIEIYRLDYYVKNSYINEVITTPIFFNPIWITKIWKTIKQLKPDLIVVRDIPLAPISILIAHIFKIKIILDMAENFPALMYINEKYIKNPISKFIICKCNLYKHMEKYSVTHSDKIFVVVEESKKRLLNEYGISENKIEIISNTPAFIPNVVSRTKDSKKLKIAYTGNIEGNFRGIQTLIEAAKLLKDYSDIEINIVGSGKYLEKILASTDIGKLKNLNLTGRLPHDELLDFLNTQDLGIVPHTRSDVVEYTIPNKIFDYMSYSLPVIVSSATPLKRIVNETDCGYVFEAENPNSLSDTILYILSHKEELEQKSQNGYTAVLNKYNWKNDSKTLINQISSMFD